MINKKRVLFIFAQIFLIVFLFSCTEKQLPDYQSLINSGEYSKAKEIIKEQLATNSDLTAEQQKKLEFEIERMDRIEKDFTKTEDEVFEYIKKYIPEVTKADLKKWEDEKSLEYKKINGEKKYFARAARNLFRINKECKNIWFEYHRKNNIDLSENKMDININNKKIIKNSLKKNQRYSEPVRMKINYSIAVKPDVVPNGETIKCWIPFPREIPNRQFDIKIIKTEPENYQLADNKILQRTIYFEKPAVENEKIIFNVEYEYTSQGEFTKIDPDKVNPSDPDGELKDYLKEEPPHIVFTDQMRKLSKKIIGDETNPYRKAQIIFEWIGDNIPWASAREYSTIRNLSSYSIENKHGDCGIMALTFITLFRLNGIPARWQSGWEFQPPHDSMHDWGMAYFEPYGWVPVDVNYGLRDTKDENLKWFYLSGMDSYRLIFNDDISKPFSPEKIHYRSETVDSQRGEVEWRGGNLYFDQWNWDMDFEVISK